MQAITQKNRYKTLTFKLTFGSQLMIVSRQVVEIPL